MKKISLENVLNYAEAQINIFKKNSKFLNLEEHLNEQATWRLTQIEKNSSECFKKGECYCGCNIYEEVFGSKGCEEKNKCYPPMLNEQDWQKYKTKNNVIFTNRD